MRALARTQSPGDTESEGDRYWQKLPATARLFGIGEERMRRMVAQLQSDGSMPVRYGRLRVGSGWSVWLDPNDRYRAFELLLTRRLAQEDTTRLRRHRKDHPREP